MIQRIQSIYLLLAALFMGGLFLQRADLIKIEAANPTVLAEMEYYNDSVLDVYDQNLLIVFAVVAILFAMLTIFLFRKRKLQITMGRLTIMVVLFFLVMVTYLSFADLQNFMDSINLGLGYGLLFPALAILMLILANRNIKKDEKLVKSMDRLR